MLGKIAGILFLVSVACAAFCGNTAALAGAVFEGAESALQLVLSLLGMMALWSGILRVLREAGAIRLLARILRPILVAFFPQASKNEEIAGDIAASMAANLLGVGNAATPMAISAMQKLQAVNPDPTRASPDMITLAVQGAAPVALVPSTVLTLLRTAGSKDPFAVILPVWVVSAFGWLLSLIFCRLCGGVLLYMERKRLKKRNVGYASA